MKVINIRAFKVVYPDGKTAFESKNSNDWAPWGCGSVRSLAKNVKSEMENFLRDNQGDIVQASIDLKPYHDIECYTDVAPRLCLPLTYSEAKEFWKQFNS
jgi:hypothetical protein